MKEGIKTLNLAMSPEGYTSILPTYPYLYWAQKSCQRLRTVGVRPVGASEAGRR
jgi:hypothetical protein